MSFYNVFDEISDLYSLLLDDLSKKVFLSRIKYDIDKSMTSELELARLSGLLSQEEIDTSKNWKETINLLRNNNKKVLLYGAGYIGKKMAKAILNDGIEFDGFCDLNYINFSDGLYEKKVYSPEWVFKNKDDVFLIITPYEKKSEIKSFLLENNFSSDHIINCFAFYENPKGDQYFEFLDYMNVNTAFVDVGCYDGADSVRFSERCKKDYSKIFAFEPDHNNSIMCRENLKNIVNLSVVEAGLSDKTTRLYFANTANKHSRIVDVDEKNQLVVDEKISRTNIDEITVFALDDFVGNEIIGFIKMDIEGAEMSALRGAEKTIVEQKPLLAICVYHKPGDVLEIMGYLHKIVPEYKFFLRHYSTLDAETVLYALLENKKREM